MKNTISLLVLLTFGLFTFESTACSPCGALSNVTSTINGTNLELTFTSNAGWDCCYTVEIEIICENESFTGVPNYFSAEICLNGGGGFSTTNSLVTPYPVTVIDISDFCPGTYSWRAAETGCFIYTPVQMFTVTGNANPISITASAAEPSICENESTQITAIATDGCTNGPYSYSWSPTAGLSNPNIANPVATPSATTTYTLTVSETGSCTTSQTADVTITVNPPPSATISGTASYCQNAPPGNVTFTGSGGTAPYVIDYTLNGVPQTSLISNGTTTIPAPTNAPGTYTYQLTSISENAFQCSQLESDLIVITINPLPVVDAGPDIELCEPNDITPSEVTLNGSGAVTYTWNNGATNGVAFTPPVGTTTYTVTGTDANGCTDTDVVNVTALTLPIANGAASDLYGNAPMTIDFTNLSQLAVSYVWDFGDGNVQPTTSLETISNTFSEPGIYTVLLTASNGICFDTWTIDIEVIPPMIVSPPNVFTPNDDNLNELYFVNVEYGAAFEAIILNRWGNKITTFSSINQGWDGTSSGKDMEEGVYFVKYKATDFNDGVIEGHTYFHLVR